MMKIPLIFQYKTEADHEALKRLKTFLEDNGCYVHEVSALSEWPLWRYILVQLFDGEYYVMLPHNIEYAETKPIDEYEHSMIIKGLEEDDAENEEMIHGEIREIIVTIANKYFYPPEIVEKLFQKK